MVREHHYMKRVPPISFCFGLFVGGEVKGVVTFGIPASRHMLLSACPEDPSLVIELNRLWVSDDMPRNTASWLMARALALMPPRIILSYADTAVGHQGFVYRASNFYYSGWTCMDRKTPRLDCITPGMHSRETSRNGTRATAERARRRPKVKYWIASGDRREKRALERMCQWPKLDWKLHPPPLEHKQTKL